MNFRKGRLLLEAGRLARSLGDPLEAEEHLQQALLDANNLLQCHTFSDASELTRTKRAVAAVNFELGLLSLTSARPIRAAIFFAFHLKIILELSSDSVSASDWEEIAKGHIEIYNALKSMEPSQAILQFLDPFLARANIAFGHSGIANGAHDQTNVHSSEGEDGEEEEEEEEEEDWDADFVEDNADNESESESDWEADMENISTPGPLRLAQVSLEEESDSDSDSSRGGVAQSSTRGSAAGLLPARYKLIPDGDNVQIQKFPKPTFFYSMQTEDGSGYIHEKELVAFLRGVVTKHSLMRMDLSVPSVQFYSFISTVPQFSREWFVSYVDYCNGCFVSGEVEECWRALGRFWNAIGGATSTGWIIGSMEVEALALQLHLAGKLWTGGEERGRELAGWAKAGKKATPGGSGLLALVHAAAWAHYSRESAERHGYLSKLLHIYHRSRNSLPTSENTLVQAAALTDLHLYLNFMSPLTTLKLHTDEMSEYHDQTFTANDYHSDSDDVSDGLDDSLWWDESDADNDTNINSLENLSAEVDVLDDRARIEALEVLYRQLDICWWKAKAAFVLGIWHSSRGSAEARREAERLFLESVYVLDAVGTGAGPWKGLAAIVSELGAAALTAYGDMLLANDKYTYAIESYEAALHNYHLRRKTESHHALLNLLPEIARTHHDHPRSLHHLHQILRKYTQQNKINEMVYVSDMLSKQYMEIGLYSHAEAHIQGAHSMVCGTGSRGDPRKIKVELDAAMLYVSSGQLIKSIDLLSHLLHLHQSRVQDLPHDRYRGVLVLLAEAYVKQRWFQEAQRVLDLLASEPLQALASASIDTSVQATMRESWRYWELRAMSYYHATLFGEALFCVEIGVSKCGGLALGPRGRAHYLRGKILHALMRIPPSSSGPLPCTRLDSDTQSYVEQLSVAQPTVSHQPSDLLQAAIASLDTAYDYFLALGDDWQLAKTLSRIAEVYLDYLFVPVALFRVPYEERARLRSFTDDDQSRHNEIGVDESSSKADLFISFDAIEGPAETCLDICAETCHPLLMLTGYMNMAELRYLQDYIGESLAFWTECRDQFVALFMDGSRVVVGDAAPVGLLEKALRLLKRLLRLMHCFDSELINKNLVLVDGYLLLEAEVEQARKGAQAGCSSFPTRPVPEMDPLSARDHVSRIIGGGRSLAAAEVNGQRPKRSLFHTWNSSSLDAERRKQSKNKVTPGEAPPSLSQSGGTAQGHSVWGRLQWVKANVTKYVSGKMSRDDMTAANRAILRQWAKARTDRRGLSRPFPDLLATCPWLSRLLYILALDQALICYAPSSGKKRIHELAGRGAGTGTGDKAGESHLWVAVHHAADEAQCTVVAASAGATGEALLRHVCQQALSHSDTDSVLNPFQPVGSGSKRVRSGSSSARGLGSATGTLHAQQPPVRTTETTSEFYPLLRQWLQFFSRDNTPSNNNNPTEDKLSTPTPTKRGHRRSKSTTTASLPLPPSSPAPTSSMHDVADEENGGEGASNLWLARRVAGEGSDWGLVPVGPDRMRTSLAEWFSPEEISQASPSHPLRLFVYFSAEKAVLADVSPRMNSMGSAPRKIHFSDAALAYVSTLIGCPLHSSPLPNRNKDSEIMVPPADLSQKALTDLANAFSSVIEMVPAAARSDMTAALHQLDLTSKNASVGGLFSWKLRRGHHTGSSRTRPSSVSGGPVLLICNATLQALPWELLLSDQIVRSFSLHHLLASPALRLENGEVAGGVANAGGLRLAALYCHGFSHSAGVGSGRGKERDKDSSIEEEADIRHREWVTRHVFRHLAGIATADSQGASYGRDVGTAWPIHTSLAATARAAAKHRRKMRQTLTLIDLAALMTARDPAAALATTLVPDGEPHSYIACVLSYADLVTSQPIVMRLAARGLTLIFAPPEHTRELVDRLAKVNEPWSRPSKPVRTATTGITTPINNNNNNYHAAAGAAVAASAGASSGAAAGGPPGNTVLASSSQRGSSYYYHALMSAIGAFQEEFLLPVPVINPPGTLPLPSPSATGLV